MRRTSAVEVLVPQAIERRLDDLLVFDTSCLSRELWEEVRTLFPQLVHVSRAWREEFREKGCRCCQKPDPTIAIAARLRRRGMSWSDVYDAVGLDRAALSASDKKKFEHHVWWRMEHPDPVERKPERRYGAGGLCDCCYAHFRSRIAKRLRVMHAGRNAEEETAALTRRSDVAQWLLHGDPQ